MWFKRTDSPGLEVCQRISGRTGVDADWLDLGDRGVAPEPEAFAQWLDAFRRGAELREEESAPGVAPRVRADADEPGARRA